MRWRLRLRTTWDEICCFFVHKEHWTGLELSIHFSLLLRPPIAPCTLWMTCRYTHFLGGICTGDFRCTRFSIRLWLWPWNNSRSLAFKSQTYDFAKSNVRAQKLKKIFCRDMVVFYPCSILHSLGIHMGTQTHKQPRWPHCSASRSLGSLRDHPASPASRRFRKNIHGGYLCSFFVPRKWWKWIHDM